MIAWTVFAMLRPKPMGKDWATPLLRSRGIGRGRQELGGKGRAALAMWGWAREAGVTQWGGTAAAGQCGVGGWVGGRSDVGLGVYGACRECTRQGTAALQGRLNPLPAATAFW